jgi:hypothetical protein
MSNVLLALKKFSLVVCSVDRYPSLFNLGRRYRYDSLAKDRFQCTYHIMQQ